MTHRLLIVNGRVLPAADQPARPADVLVENGRIQALSAPGAFAGVAASRVLDATARLLITGLVNAHAHAHCSLGRGAVPDVALEGFLAASPAINGHRTLDDLARRVHRDGARPGLSELHGQHARQDRCGGPARLLPLATAAPVWPPSRADHVRSAP